MKKLLNAKKNIYLFKPIVISCIFFLIDLLPIPYWTDWLERFFSYDFAVIIPIGLALWTFTTSLMILMIEKKDECHMGITYHELYKIKARQYPYGLEQLMLILIIFLVLSAFLQLPITMFACILMQMHIMIQMFYMMQGSLSKEAVEQLIQNDLYIYLHKKNAQIEKTDIFRFPLFQDGKDELLIVKSIKRIDLSHSQERETFIQLLPKSGLYQLAYEEAVLIGMYLTDHILASSAPKTELHSLIDEWFLTKDCSLGIQKGIILSLSKNSRFHTKHWVYPLLNLMDALGKTKEMQELKAWYITACTLLPGFEAYKETIIFLPQLQNCYRQAKIYFPAFNWDDKILGHWQSLCHLTNCRPTDHLDLLYKILFSN